MSRVAPLLVFLVVSLTGCELVDFLRNDHPGAKRLARESVGGPAWSPDGKEIFYTIRAGSQVTDFTLKAVKISNSSRRSLVSVQGWNTGGEAVRTTADPSKVFFAIAGVSGNRYSIYRTTSAGGQATTVTTQAAWPWFEVSRNASRLAFQSPTMESDTIQVMDLEGIPHNKTPLITDGRPNVLGISPTGNTLAYRSESGIYVASTAGGAPRLLYQTTAHPAEDQTRFVSNDIGWHGESPQVFIASFSENIANQVQFHRLDGDTGTLFPIGVYDGAVALPQNLTPSSDGSSIAAWVPVKIVGHNQERTVHRFHLIRLSADTSPTILLDWTSDESLRWLEFSPDNRRVALVSEGFLYVVDR